MPVASSSITTTPMLLVATLVITSPEMYSETDRGEENRFKKLRDQTSSRKAVETPCMMRVQKSHNSTPPSSVGTKSIPPALTELRYRVMKPHSTMSMATHVTMGNRRTGLPRIK